MFSLFCRNFDLNEDDDMEDDEYDPLVVEEAADQWPPASGTHNSFSSNGFI